MYTIPPLTVSIASHCCGDMKVNYSKFDPQALTPPSHPTAHISWCFTYLTRPFRGTIFNNYLLVSSESSNDLSEYILLTL